MSLRAKVARYCGDRVSTVDHISLKKRKKKTSYVQLYTLWLPYFQKAVYGYCTISCFKRAVAVVIIVSK